MPRIDIPVDFEELEYEQEERIPKKQQLDDAGGKSKKPRRPWKHRRTQEEEQL